MTNFDKLIQEVEIAKTENAKFQKGNQASARRTRNSLLAIKKLSLEARKDILELHKANELNKKKK